MVRSWPNIVFTGTPGTGKSTHATVLLSHFPGSSSASGGASSSTSALRHIDVGLFAKQNNLLEKYDDERDAHEVDEDALLDLLEPLSGGVAPEPLEEDEQGAGAAAGEDLPADDDEKRGGLLLDWHTCDLWPERWIDLVVVFRCDHTTLWDRLEKRGYAESKVQENNQAEIMEVCLDEARSAYAAEAIVELHSDTQEQVEQNVDRLVAWIQQWRKERGLSTP
ncbi:factor activating pos9 [Tilletia horrida]|uniref:Adenylate kinase isoenzyme 6 homolog n=1 Tax=Tilletia horrida TaxID=155126 RepID=A0AAN6JIZ6_9BASI|nr:factor activating pos9 [Tilletia horrida]KAK0532040.1 factor activating pos9 [Tilletia horrida]